MGNFSRDTFDPAKRYTAVRLQQGVPLVDADWNELQDVTRDELYAGLGTALPNAAQPGGLVVSADANDLLLSPGIAIAGGAPARLADGLRYSTQRYADPASAAADGVPVVPPLTPPPALALRQDAVYLDVFEREVGSAEDPALVNPAIGLETAVRRRRELVLRVAEGAAAPPAPPVGHAFLQLALLSRFGTLMQVEDVVPRPRRPALAQLSVAPFVHNLAVLGSTAGYSPWFPSQGVGTVVATKAPGTTSIGIVPLSLPDGARLRTVRVRGQNNGTASLSVQLMRLRLDSGTYQQVFVETIVGGAFDRTIAVPQAGLHTVDNDTFSYVVYLFANFGDTIELRGLEIRYVP